MNFKFIILVSLIVVVLSTPARADFQVNSYTTEWQENASVFINNTGDFVVVWQSRGSYGTDYDPSSPVFTDDSIQGQRYASDGSFLGSQFQINTYTTGHQTDPETSCDNAGNFVVVWQTWGSNYGDVNGLAVQGQRFASNGDFLDSQFQINTYTTGNQWNPAINVNATGDFVVVWQSVGSDQSDTNLASIQAQRYSSTGGIVGSQFQVNTYTTGNQYAPEVCVKSDGDFVVVWQSYGSNYGDTSYWSVQGQRFSSSGAFLGSQFQLNSYTTLYQEEPSVGVDVNGTYTMVWHSLGSDTQTTESVQARRMSSTGSFLGSQFQVSAYSHWGYHASISVENDGDFVVVWQSFGSDFGDTDHCIQGQRFSSTGSFLGTQFLVNTYGYDTQESPDVNVNDNGDFVVAWESYTSPYSDTSYSCVMGRQFESVTPPTTPTLSQTFAVILFTLLGLAGGYFLLNKKGRMWCNLRDHD
ncbi:hypothetical protein ACFL27_19370 [candidate division CSSED10-310 bacterium]|uniref:Uncharacterized protein n=1 Tax=candidate division CSSED10-310 bacterium TaxID=2855610 RepID=A0ABV6Z1Q9_UNCC1